MRSPHQPQSHYYNLARCSLARDRDTLGSRYQGWLGKSARSDKWKLCDTPTGAMPKIEAG